MESGDRNRTPRSSKGMAAKQRSRGGECEAAALAVSSTVSSPPSVSVTAGSPSTALRGMLSG
eukprot:11552957-Alexandrium_andersonii.AAC.1